MFHKAFRLLFVFILVFGSVAVQVPTPTRAAGPWYVAPTGDDGNDCLSPDTPCATINGAIGKASSGDTIHVAEGTYTGSGSEVILIDRDISLSGGWDATFAGQNGTTIVDGETVRRGVTVNAGTTSSLDRFILLNGNKTGGGGGINNSGALTLSNLSISDNRWGIGDGGGIANNQTGVITMNHTTLTRNGNQDLCNGTAIWNQGAITANDSAIFDNQVADIFCGIGSAVINHTGDGYRGSIVLNNSTVSNNSPGGGIYNYGDLTLNNSTVSHNVGDDSNGPGGIYNSVDGILSINSSTIAENTSAGFGGGVFNIGFGTGSVSLQNSIINGNMASAGADCFGMLNSLGHNLLGSATDCTFAAADGDLTDVDAKLGILVGSPAYRPLLPDSPAVDAGRPGGCTDHNGNLLATDQRGAARLGTCDIGAFEFTPPGPASSLFIIGGDQQRTLTGSPYPDPFQVAALDSQGSPVDGVTVDFTAPDSGSSGTFADTGTHMTSSNTDAAGVAVSSTFTANDQVGTYQVSASADGAGFAHFHLEQVGRPANDDFANAEIISSLPFSDTVDITDASKEPGELLFCTGSPQGQSVWYSFTPATTMVVGADMAGSSFGDTNLAVYQSAGPGLEGLSLITATCFGGSLSFTAQAGTTYYIQAERLFGGGGELHVNLQGFAAPANDNFADATAITELPFSTVVDNTGATAEAGEPTDCGFPFRSVWYSFAPGEAMTLRLDLPISQNGGTVSVYRADEPGIAGLAFIACASTGGFTNISMEAGEIYYLRVDSFGQPGQIQFNLDKIIPPGNDKVANAEPIALPFSATIDTTNATLEPGEPQGCHFAFPSVWYTFTPAENMVLRVFVDSPNSGSANLFLSSDSQMSDLTSLGCAYTGASSSRNFQVEAGKTYFLRVDASGDPRTVQLHLEQVSPPANDNFADAQAIDTLPFNVLADNTNATMEADEPLGCGGSARSIWYRIMPADDLPIRVSAAGNGVSATMTIFAANGPGISDLTFITCTGSSPRNLVLDGGATYYLLVNSFGLGGPIQVSVEPLNPPANDNFADAVPVSELPFNASVDVTDTTFEPDEPFFCGNTPGTAWYSFSPEETISVRANTLGSAIAGNVTVLRSNGSGFAGLEFMGCSAAGGSVSFLAEAEQTYYFQVGAASGQAGMVQFNLVPVITPPNDNLVNAVEVGSLPFSASVDATDASRELDEPSFCAFMPGTVWYSFTPVETVKVRADTLGSPIDANANVYLSVGEGFANMQFLGCSGFGGAVAFLAEAGQTYYFQVGGNGQGSPVQLNLAEVPSISGRLTDAVSGTPLPGDMDPFAFVQLNRVCGENCLEFVNSQTTDGNGGFFFDSYHFGSPLPAGEYVVHAFANLYYQRQFGPFTFSLTNLDVGDLALTPSAVVRGRLVDAASGAPLAGASLTLNRCHDGNCFEFVNSQSSDGEGAFRFNSYYFPEPLPAGTYELLISAPGYEPKRVELLLAEGEDHDLGDVPVDPIPAIGSISGRLVDSLSGAPLTPEFSPFVELQSCNPDFCSTVASMVPDGEGRFRFETDAVGTPLPAGDYRILAYADQYEFVFTEPFEVGEGMHRTTGDLPLVSFPVRFTDVRACDVIPASGGECEFSVRVSNGMSRALRGRTWSIAGVTLPDSVIGFSQFQVNDPQDIDLGVGRSRVFRFRLKVPEHTSPFDGSVCAQVFAGEGSQAYFNTLGTRVLFCVVRSGTGFEIVSPQEVTAEGALSAQAATGVAEVEPNNSCQAAQDMGMLAGPQTVNGLLDTGEAPDIDFFRFTGTPGAAIAIDHEGSATGKGTLADPLLGFFDSNCNLLTYNDDSSSLNSYLEMSVPDDGVFILAATSYPDFGFQGGGFGSYQMTVEAVEPIGSIRGVVVDTVTGAPLAGDSEPFAFVSLLDCNPFFCSTINYQAAASDGSFHFETDFGGNPLTSGRYQILVSASQYQSTQSEGFRVFAGEDHDLGSIALQSYPVRFSDLQVCSVPSRGGQCDFSVRVSNGLPTRLTGRAWTLVDGHGLASYLGYTIFQPEATRDISLRPGASTLLRFRFQVPAGVQDGSFLCVTAYVGQNPDPLYNTAGVQDRLFCFQKGADGFTLMTGGEMQERLHQSLLEAPPPFRAPGK